MTKPRISYQLRNCKYVIYLDLDLHRNILKPRKEKGTLWVYGDCYAYHLYEEIWNTTLCMDLFKDCKK